jgi:hypothetical protein
MNRWLRWVVPILAIGLLATAAFAQSGREGPPRNVILIGWDGAQRAHLQECLARGELPTIKALAEEGALVDIDVITGATDTKAGWTQILTGYHPEVTGVYSNSRYRDVPEGLSIFERLKKHFGPDFVCVAVIGKREHCGEIRAPFKKQLTEEEAQQFLEEQKRAQEKQRAAQKLKAAQAAGQAGAQVQAEKPKQAGQVVKQQAEKKQQAQPGAGRQILGRIVEEGGVKYLVFEGSPYYTMHKACDVWEYGLMEDEKVGSLAIQLIEKYKDRPFFFFVHFASVDHLGHRFGENSKEYNDALISNDAWTGRIVQKLKELGLYDKTLVYVTADHGFDEDKTTHSYAPYVFLATNDPLVKRAGMRQDIAPTILDRFGIDLSKLEPPLDGEPLTKPATKPVLKAPETKPAPAAPQRQQERQRAAAKKREAATVAP